MLTKDPVEIVEVKAVLTGNWLYEAILAAAEAWYSKGFTLGNKGFKEFVVQHVQSVEGGEEVWALIHCATWVAIGIPGYTDLSHMTMASMARITGMAPLK